MPRENGMTRQEILDSIKTYGAMTAEELSQRLNISSVAVRQHLTAMESERTVAVTVERRGLGRPAHRYSLTASGDESFPRSYDLLALQLLDELEEERGNEIVQQLASARHEATRQLLERQVVGRSFETRLVELARFETEQGYMAEAIEETSAADGERIFVKRNCAICAVAKKYPELCCAGMTALYQSVLGAAEVCLEASIPEGATSCTFRVQQKSPTLADDSNASKSTDDFERSKYGARNNRATLPVLTKEADAV